MKSLFSRGLNRSLYIVLSISSNIQECIINWLFFLYRINFSKPLIEKIFYCFNLEIRKIVDLDKCCKLYPDLVEFIYQRENVFYYSYPVYSDDKSIIKELHKIERRYYGAVFKSVCVIGGSNLLLVQNNTVLYDLASSNRDSNYKYIDGAIHYYKGDLFLIEYDKSIVNLDQGILVSGNFSWNYFHLLYEILAKFKEINENGIDLTVPLLVDKKCQDVPQFQELFTIFNRNSRGLIFLDFGKRYKVEKLFYFSTPNFIPTHFLKESQIKASDCLYNFSVLGFLRNTLLTYAINKDFPKRVFISRSMASDRRRFNEDDVFCLFEKHGFIKIYPENYSIAEQITLFNRADYVAGGSGAAFTNLLFCKKTCKVICFVNYKVPLSLFSTIAEYIGFSLIYFYDSTKTIRNKSQLHDPFKINLKELNVFLPGWLSLNSNI